MWSRKGRGDGTSQPKATCTKNEDCVAFKSEPKNDKKKSPGLIFLQLQNRRQGLTDVVIECQDSSFCRVHQHMLLATSPGFQNLLSEKGDYDDIGHIIIAALKFSFREIARILFLIYCGKTMVIGEEEQELLDEGLYVFFYKESLQNRLDPYPLRSLGRPKLNEMLKEFKDMYLRFTWVENRSKRDYFICCNGDIKVAAGSDSDYPFPSYVQKSNTFPQIIYKRPVNRPQCKKPIFDPSRSFQRRNISNIVLGDTTVSPNQLDHTSTGNDDDFENPESESDESRDGSFTLQKCTSEFLASFGYKKNCNKRKIPEDHEIFSKKTKNKRAAAGT